METVRVYTQRTSVLHYLATFIANKWSFINTMNISNVDLEVRVVHKHSHAVWAPGTLTGCGPGRT